MKKVFALVCLLAVSAPAIAAAPSAALPATLKAFVPEGFELTQRLDADFDGDKHTDTSLLLSRVDNAADDRRRLLVLLARGSAYVLAGQADLDFNPTPPILQVRKGVLIVEHENGGASNSVLAAWRYRYEAASQRMRLIGVDISRYSRTNSTDAIEYSFNALTGDRTIKRSEIIDENPDGTEIANADRTYRDLPTEKQRLRVPRWYMEDTPDPYHLLSGKQEPAERKL